MKAPHLLCFTILLLCFNASPAFASMPGGSLMGKVIDPATNEPVSDAMVVFSCQGSQKIFTTNEHGYYYASNLPAGVYTVTVSFMSNKQEVKDVKVVNDEQVTLDIPLSSAVNIIEAPIVYERNPLINPIDPTVVKLDKGTIQKTTVSNIDGLLETLGKGAIQVNGEYHVQGSREGGVSYYIDGSKVMGNPNIPLSGLESYMDYTGFIPAKYGDATGAVIVIETRSYFTER